MNAGDESPSEVEIEEPLISEDASFTRKLDDKPTRQWLMPLLLGTGLGFAIALGGVGAFKNQAAPQQKAVANKSASPANPSMTVTIASVESASIAQTLNATGTVAASDLIPVLPQTNGLQIKQIPDNVKEGAFVKKGQVLAVLDDSVLQTQISQAKADVQSKQADVESKQADVASKQATAASNLAVVKQRQADLAQAQARLEEAEKNFQRYQKLAASGAISQQELDTRSYTVKTAKESVRVAQENVRSAQANVGNGQANISIAQANVTKAEADVRSSAARVVQLQTQLGQTLVIAPVSGIIAEKLARVGDVTGVPPQTQVGNIIGGTQKLFSIIRDRKLELQAKVPEIQLPQVKVGATVEVTSDLDRRIELQGKVREIQPLVNDQRREATVKIDLPPTNLLKSGMFARAAISTNSALGMTVPQKAVQAQPDGSVIVFMLSGEDIVLAQKVELGEPINGNRVQIKSGLKLGDRVVVKGAGYLKDGDKVLVVTSPLKDEG
ncbi:MAG: efflux RND transporter periplasmic adaptor subunit [Aulosira sp. ZfuVER01]|nr:efflux RND transporter periplasmic adaptor subunit [Aulosira sp. ZfuVER01]MDZ8000256.1 efflux RND transporter periplasmic adaptor subunit [Aulosira sp. DedVER01a]MDZ8053376.1 efflux RND transporter periplasmic adaptor subunit [Aulosira sp. ZfuCHP01]